MHYIVQWADLRLRDLMHHPAKLLTTVKLPVEGMYAKLNVKMVDKPTCYKNPMNPSRIGLNLTNSPKYFRNSNVFDTGVSDFHKMTV